MRRRRRPKNRIAGHDHPLHLFVAGAALIVAFLLQTNLIVRLCQVAFFAVTATLAGKRIRPLYFLMITASITIFNLLTPVGQVLFRVAGLPITRGALEQGLSKGFAIVGLVLVSLTSVSRELALPGAFGGLIGRVFSYFEQVLEGKGRVSARHLVESIDEILLGIYPSGEVAVVGPRDRSTTPVGAALLVATVGANIALAVIY
jgi:hypothetical protein